MRRPFNRATASRRRACRVALVAWPWLFLFAPSVAAQGFDVVTYPGMPGVEPGADEPPPLYVAVECPAEGCDPSEVTFGEYNPPTDPESQSAAVSGGWSLDLPSAAGGAVLAGLLGLLAWGALSWAKSAAMPGAAAWPLFSRLDGPALLNHPVRARILNLVREEPGVHFQEIARRLGLAQGVAAHHLYALVAAGVLVKQAGPRYSLYFVRGAVDRRLMTVAPLLRAPGARDVLGRLLGAPRATTHEIASALGLARSTVKFHLRRLVGSGLATPILEGRTLRFEGTELALAAMENLPVPPSARAQQHGIG